MIQIKTVGEVRTVSEFPKLMKGNGNSLFLVTHEGEKFGGIRLRKSSEETLTERVGDYSHSWGELTDTDEVIEISNVR